MSIAERTQLSRWEERVATRLEELRTTYPTDSDFIIWTYTALTGPENLTKEQRNDLIYSSNDKLRSTYREYKARLDHLDKEGLPDTKQAWFDRDVKRLLAKSGYGLIYGDVEIKISNSNNPNRAPSYGKEYSLQQRLLHLLPAYRKTTIEDVVSFIDSKNEQRELRTALAKEEEALDKVRRLDFSDREMALDFPIPQLDRDAIKIKAQNLNPLSAEEITSYAMDVGLEVKAVVAWLSKDFIDNAAKPRNLTAHLSKVAAEIRKVDVSEIVIPDPGFFTKLRNRSSSRVSLLPAEEMPLAAVQREAAKIPKIAAADNELLSKDLKIVDHLLEVLNAYHNILLAHKDALQEERETLEANANDRDGLIAGIAATNVPRNIEDTLARIDKGLAFMQAFAGNFHTMSISTAQARQNLPDQASLAATIQLPMLEAIQAFRMNELAHQQKLGREINGTITSRVGVNENKIPLLNDFTAAQAETRMNVALQEMIRQLDRVPEAVMTPLRERDAVAVQMRKTLADGPV